MCSHWEEKGICWRVFCAIGFILGGTPISFWSWKEMVLIILFSLGLIYNPMCWNVYIVLLHLFVKSIGCIVIMCVVIWKQIWKLPLVTIIVYFTMVVAQGLMRRMTSSPHWNKGLEVKFSYTPSLVLWFEEKWKATELNIAGCFPCWSQKYQLCNVIPFFVKWKF